MLHGPPHVSPAREHNKYKIYQLDVGIYIPVDINGVSGIDIWQFNESRNPETARVNPFRVWQPGLPIRRSAPGRWTYRSRMRVFRG